MEVAAILLSQIACKIARGGVLLVGGAAAPPYSERPERNHPRVRMYPTTRFDTLCRMIDLRCLTSANPPAEAQRRHTALEMERKECSEALVLEIAEVAHVLRRADGLRNSEVAQRLARVYGPMPSEVTDAADPFRASLVHLLKLREPAYLERGQVFFDTALGFAVLWGELFAERLAASDWPPPGMLTEPWDIGGYAGISRTGEGPHEWPTFGGSLDDLDILLEEYGPGRGAVGVRRMKARANPGDQLHGYSTGKLSWTLMGGRSGIALVRNGRSIDVEETMMN